MTRQLTIDNTETDGFAARIRNRGQSQGTQTVELYKDGVLVTDEVNLTLTPDETAYVLEAPSVFSDASHGQTLTMEVVTDNMTRTVEVLISGIPNSAIAQFDASALSLTDGGSVTTWTDETGNGNDLTAGNAPTFIESAMGGQPVVRFDGVDDYLDVSFGSTYSQPNTIIMAVRFEGSLGTSDSDIYFDGTTTGERHQLDQNATSDDIRLFAGSLADTTFDNDNNKHLMTVIYDGTDTKFRVDGSIKGTVDAGTEPLSGLTLGASITNTDNAQIDVGKFVLYNADLSLSGDLSIEESRIANKYGITI